MRNALHSSSLRSGASRRGLRCGRELRSSRPRQPSCWKRRTHLAAVLELTLNSVAAKPNGCRSCVTLSANSSRRIGVSRAFLWMRIGGLYVASGTSSRYKCRSILPPRQRSDIYFNIARGTQDAYLHSVRGSAGSACAVPDANVDATVAAILPTVGESRTPWIRHRT